VALDKKKKILPSDDWSHQSQKTYFKSNLETSKVHKLRREGNDMAMKCDTCEFDYSS